MLGSLAFFFGGALHIQLRNSGNYLDTSILPFADRQDINLVGHVIRDGRIREGESGEVTQSVDIEAEEIHRPKVKRSLFILVSG